MAEKTMSPERYRLQGAYERWRRKLLADDDQQKLHNPLSYWVVRTDRRLPLAFLNQPLRELLALELDELLATPGVGQKKILAFLDLLRRAAKPDPPREPFGLPSTRRVDSPQAGPFDPNLVSEELWRNWCETVRHLHLEECLLGRIAPSLLALPSVIWRKTLGEYVGLSLAELRQLPIHGEKRVHAILEVFSTVHEALSTSVLPPSLELQLVPRNVAQASRWLLDVCRQGELPPVEQLHAQVVVPLVQQLEIDLGPELAHLVRERLQIADAPSVRRQADQLSVTRARVYQLLEECVECLDLRWPEGRWLLGSLAGNSWSGPVESRELLQALHVLLFPPGRQTPLADAAEVGVSEGNG